jgi:hypothetical protein
VRRLALLRNWVHQWLSKLARENAALRRQVSDQIVEISDLRGRLALSIEAQQKASEQLIAERALRQSSDERADRYHEELTDALKSNVDWLARGLYHRRPMFGVGAPPDEPKQESKPQAMPGKRMAREIAREIARETDKGVTNEVLADMLAQIRNGAEAMPVGPEFTTQ